MNLCDRETLRALLERHGFYFSKSMGQNFLIDPEIPRRIAEASGADKSCGVLEIGPGVGVLTRELAARAGKVAAVELDRSLLPVLAETLADCPNAEVVPGDALRLDLGALAAEKFQGLRPVVCANLPYNITTPVLTRLTETPCFGEITVMVQREVAQRICAAPGDPACGAFSLMMQYRMETEYLFDVPRESFLPAPKVTSAVIRCVRREQPAVTVSDQAFFFRIIRGAFLLRRKTLVNSLSAALPELGKDAVRDAVAACNLPDGIRGERLTLAELAELTRILQPQLRG
ncbi:MAG: 16S rRNA (adenine(1518)-N(6)/adenine(1519)-N(6))-dimethyltransferase RsmA [Oscillibacter sp.]|nr:16S rRNA (adenine(1518)-N(6)/adenine(1519)-N(6))-dimethyltransferase RsmA [Oscillibacter sp.]